MEYINCSLSGRLICVLFSPCREKSTKRAPRKGGPQVPPLRNPPPMRATPSPTKGRRSLNARKVEDSRGPARTAERRPRGTCPKRGEERENPSNQPRERGKPASSALRRGCGHPATREVTAHKALLPPGKRARRTGDRILKESTWVLSLSGDSFGTFLSPRKEKYIILSPR